MYAYVMKIKLINSTASDRHHGARVARLDAWNRHGTWNDGIAATRTDTCSYNLASSKRHVKRILTVLSMMTM